MMEFTCDGMVRMGYGFYNPNHAAALICALLPFLWEWFLQTRRKMWKITAILLNLLLLTALVFTFSRTGIIIVILEAFLFAALKHKIHWKWITIFAIVMLTLLCISGLWMRFRLDGAVLNRPKIWWAGLQLSAVNPLGVGSGNSGKLATAFLLPEGVQCLQVFSGLPHYSTHCRMESGKLPLSAHWPDLPSQQRVPQFLIGEFYLTFKIMANFLY